MPLILSRYAGVGSRTYCCLRQPCTAGRVGARGSRSRAHAHLIGVSTTCGWFRACPPLGNGGCFVPPLSPPASLFRAVTSLAQGLCKCLRHPCAVVPCAGLGSCRFRALGSSLSRGVQPALVRIHYRAPSTPRGSPHSQLFACLVHSGGASSPVSASLRLGSLWAFPPPLVHNRRWRCSAL